MVKKKADAPADVGVPADAGGRRGKTDYNVSPEVFIATWQASNSATEVAERLGMPKDIVHARASTYRQAGVRLKKMKRHANKALDVARLNAIVDEIDRRKAGEATTSPLPQPARPKDQPLVPEDVRSIVQKVLSRIGEESFSSPPREGGDGAGEAGP